MPGVSRIFVRLPNWVGDVCMCLPALELLAASGAALTLCGRPWARELLAGLPEHDFVPMRGRLREDRRAVRERVRRLDRGGRAGARGLLLPDSLSSAAVFRLAGLRSAGYRDDGRSLLLRWPLAKPDRPVHAVESWYGLARTALQRWGCDPGPQRPADRLALPLTPAHRQAADRLLDEAGLRAGAFVLIAPTATGLHRGRVKVWPHFDALARALQARGQEVAMCPPPAETGAARGNAPTARLLPSLPLGAFAALTARAGLVICNDSGVSHIAAAAGARQITLFGVTRPGRSGPWTPDAVCLGREDAWPDMRTVERQAMALLDAAHG